MSRASDTWSSGAHGFCAAGPMEPERSTGSMVGMNGSHDARRVLIPVAAPPSAEDSPTGREAAPTTSRASPVRRYRLGRMPLYTRPDPAADRFAHLRRGYD